MSTTTDSCELDAPSAGRCHAGQCTPATGAMQENSVPSSVREITLVPRERSRRTGYPLGGAVTSPGYATFYWQDSYRIRSMPATFPHRSAIARGRHSPRGDRRRPCIRPAAVPSRAGATRRRKCFSMIEDLQPTHRTPRSTPSFWPPTLPVAGQKSHIVIICSLCYTGPLKCPLGPGCGRRLAERCGEHRREHRYG
jgi:hypothetical protein